MEFLVFFILLLFSITSLTFLVLDSRMALPNGSSYFVIICVTVSAEICPFSFYDQYYYYYYHLEILWFFIGDSCATSTMHLTNLQFIILTCRIVWSALPNPSFNIFIFNISLGLSKITYFFFFASFYHLTFFFPPFRLNMYSTISTHVLSLRNDTFILDFDMFILLVSNV